MRLLFLCGALAFGEWIASLYPSACTTYPIFLFLGVVLALYLHAFSFPYWQVVFMAFLGVALYFYAVSSRAEEYKLSPWVRHGRKRIEFRQPSPVKKDISTRIGVGLDHCREIASINRAILLGERKALPRELSKAFVDAGTIHIFAVSGLHVMVIAKTLMVLLMLILVPQRIAGVVSLIPLWWYITLVGSPPSAVRAGVMASLNMLAPLFWRESDSLRSWAITFLLVHLIDPKMIADVGCNLSFMVMLALVLASRGAKFFHGWLAEAAFFSVVAWAAGTPISANVFGRVTPGGLLANLVLLPAAGISVSVGALGVMASYISQKIGAHLNNLSALTTSAMSLLSSAVSSLPMSSYKTLPWNPLVCAIWYFALFALLAYLARKKRHRCI